MAEKVGEIYYEVSLDTSKMVADQRVADKVTGQLEARLTETAAAAKIHTTATNLAAQAMRNAAGAATEATGATGTLAQVTETAAKNLAEQVAASTSLAAVSGGLVAAIAATVAVIGLVALGYIKGTGEMVEFKRELALTGNQSGVTSDQLNVLAQRLDSLSGVTRSKAAEALTVFTKAGIQGEDALAKFTEAAIRLEEAGGPAVEKTAAAFKALGEDPLRAALKLNDSVNFLTKSTYEQIRSLEQQGKTTEAAKVAQDSYADSLLSRAPTIIENIGLIERGWRGVKNAAKEAWDAVLGVGRTKTPEEALEGTRARIDDLKRQLAGGGFGETGGGAATGIAMGSRARAEKTALLDALQEQVRLYERAQLAAQGSAEADAKRLDQVKALADFDKSGEKFLESRARMERDIAAARQLGVQAGLSDIQIEARIQEIRNAYAKKGGGGGATQFDSAGYLAGLEQQTVEAYARIDAVEQEALRKNAKLLDDKKITAADAEQAITLIQAKAHQDRLDLQLRGAGAIYDAMVTGYAKEAELAKRQAEEQNKGRDFASQITVENDPIAKLQQELETKSALLAHYSAIDEDNLLLYAQAKLALERDTAAKILEIRKKQVTDQQASESQQLQNYQNLFSGLAGVVQAFSGKQNSLFRALFAASKAFAIADAIIKIQQGIASAAALPFPTNLGAIGTVVAATAGIVSTIQSTNYRQYGGPTNAGSLYRVNETGRPEMFTAANGNQYMMANTGGNVTPADGIGGGNVFHQEFNIGAGMSRSEVYATMQSYGQQLKGEILDSIHNNGAFAQRG